MKSAVTTLGESEDFSLHWVWNSNYTGSAFKILLYDSKITHQF